MGCYVAFSYRMFMLAGTVTRYSPFKLEILSKYPHMEDLGIDERVILEWIVKK